MENLVFVSLDTDVSNQGLDTMPNWLTKNLADMNVTGLFPIQAKTISYILENRSKDVIVESPTGSGKTLCYAIPIVLDLCKRVVPCLRAIIIVPHHNLVLQVLRVFETISKDTGLRIYRDGDDIMTSDIAVCTPQVLLEQMLCPEFTLEYCETIVMDEMDRVLARGSKRWIEMVFRATELKRGDILSFRKVEEISVEKPYKTLSLNKRFLTSTRIMLFSATVTRNPLKLSYLRVYEPTTFIGRSGGHNNKKYFVPLSLEEYMVSVHSNLKPLYVLYIMKAFSYKSCLCFAGSWEIAKKLSKLFPLLDSGIKFDYIVNTDTEKEQEDKINKFSTGQIEVLISTDFLSRGMDLDVECVINYDMPQGSKSYVHRAGRTARAGKRGCVYTLVGEDDMETFHSVIGNHMSYNGTKTLEVDMDVFHKMKEVYGRVLLEAL